MHMRDLADAADVCDTERAEAGDIARGDGIAHEEATADERAVVLNCDCCCGGRPSSSPRFFFGLS